MIRLSELFCDVCIAAMQALISHEPDAHLSRNT